MRILTITIAAATALWAAHSFSEEKRSKPEIDEQILSEKTDEVDSIITGVAILPEDIEEWERRSRFYAECPGCQEPQPYPED